MLMQHIQKLNNNKMPHQSVPMCFMYKHSHIELNGTHKRFSLNIPKVYRELPKNQSFTSIVNITKINS